MMRSHRVLRGALRSASLLALLLICSLALNILLLGYAVFRTANTAIDTDIGFYADALSQGEGLSAQQERLLVKQGCWLMLLDSSGRVISSYQKPPELADSYSIQDVAGFTRWYLMDYPVHVRTMDEGLLVMGFPKNSLWKYTFETPLSSFMFWPVWVGVALACNFLLILLLSVGGIKRTYRKRDAVRSEWIAAVSHDVRTPLAAVLGYAGNLEQEPSLSASEREQAKLIRQKGEELRSLIENLNITNRLEYSMEPLDAHWLSPAAIVREAVVYFLNDESLTAFPVEADIQPSAAEMQIYGDRALLERMLKNLIGNSIRHNSQGCDVTVSLWAKGRRLTLCVSDSGAGYAKDMLLKLNGGKTTLTSGHGLGLTIVRQIVHAHGGRIHFSNSPSGGAACTIVFGRRAVRKAPVKDCSHSDELL